AGGGGGRGGRGGGGGAAGAAPGAGAPAAAPGGAAAAPGGGRGAAAAAVVDYAAARLRNPGFPSCRGQQRFTTTTPRTNRSMTPKATAFLPVGLDCTQPRIRWWSSSSLNSSGSI